MIMALLTLFMYMAQDYITNGRLGAACDIFGTVLVPI
jgi:hypothetical protein